MEEDITLHVSFEYGEQSGHYQMVVPANLSDTLYLFLADGMLFANGWSPGDDLYVVYKLGEELLYQGTACP